MINEIHENLRKAWMKDVGYLRTANDLQLDPEMVKSLFEAWTKESMNEMGLSN